MGSSQKFYGVLLLVQLLFGIQYVASKYVLSALPPLVWASLRATAAAFLFGLTAYFLGKLDPKRALQQAKPLIVFALLSTAINQGCFLYGLTYTTVTNSALLNTLIPVFTLLIVTCTGREHFSLVKFIGTGIALLGALSLNRFEDLSLSNQTFLGDLLTIANSLCYSFFLAFSKPFLERENRLWATTWFFIYGCVALWVLSIPQWSDINVPPFSWEVTGAMIFSVVGGTFLTYLLVNYAIAHVPASVVALFIYLQPIIAGGMGWWLLNESITPRTLVSAGLIFVGVYLSVQKSNAKAKSLSQNLFRNEAVRKARW